MRRWGGLLVVAAALLLLTAPSGSGATPIPGTPLSVVALGASEQTVAFGASANFSWGLYNGGPGTYAVNITAVASDPTFAVEVVPTGLTIRRDDFLEVYLNATAPRNGAPRTAALRVWFNTTAPVPSSLQVNASLTARIAPASVDVLTAFVAIAGIIIIGFTAVLIFERTHIPDLLILIFLGLLLGPIALTYFGVVFVPAGVLQLATPYFTAIALMFILFDGGLNLRLAEVVKKLGIVGLHTGFTFLLTVFAVAFVAAMILGYPWLIALLLGAVLGGTSGAVVIGIVRALHVSDETKIILTLESVLTDVLCVVTVLALMELLRGGPGASVTIVFSDLGQAFLVALGTGLVAGVGWLLLLQRVEKKPFSYMLTIAILFLLYSTTEVFGGSGAMASFVFGLVLGNHMDFAKRMRMRARFVIDDRIKQFHAEFAFVIRTFFFVFLGLVFTFAFAGQWNVSSVLPGFSALDGTFTLFLIGVVLIFLVIVGVRILGARIVAAIRKPPPAERRILWSLMGRGLAAAVLASLPFTIPSFSSPSSPADEYYQSVLAPYQVQFLNIAFYVILLTVLTTTIGVVVSERALGRTTRVALPAGVDGPGLQFLREADLDDVEVIHEAASRRPESPRRRA